MSAAIDELRAALYASLEVEDDGGFAAWKPVVDRVSAAVRAVAELAEPPPHTDIVQLVAEFRAEADRRGRYKLARQNPLYPWGLVGYADGLAEGLRYREVARDHHGPCNCALVREHQFGNALQSKDFVKTGESDDFYDRYEDYQCPHCGAAWRHADCSTEQYTSWGWVPL